MTRLSTTPDASFLICTSAPRNTLLGVAMCIIVAPPHLAVTTSEAFLSHPSLRPPVVHQAARLPLFWKLLSCSKATSVTVPFGPGTITVRASSAVTFPATTSFHKCRRYLKRNGPRWQMKSEIWSRKHVPPMLIWVFVCCDIYVALKRSPFP
jgi:hypothetical protein